MAGPAGDQPASWGLGFLSFRAALVGFLLDNIPNPARGFPGGGGAPEPRVLSARDRDSMVRGALPGDPGPRSPCASRTGGLAGLVRKGHPRSGTASGARVGSGSPAPGLALALCTAGQPSPGPREVARGLWGQPWGSPQDSCFAFWC